MQFTYYGQSCFSIQIAGKQLLFDPFITGNSLAADIDIQQIKADYIFVSHGHFDHVADLISIAKNTNATVVAAFEITEWCSQQGIEKVHPLNLGGKWNFSFGTVKFVAAAHSSVLPDGTYGGAAGGFVFTTQEGNFYYSGDTALMLDMQLIPRYTKIDLAILPIGDNFTMGAEDAILAAGFIECNRIIGVHFDTFGYIKIDHEKTLKQFSDAGLQLTLPTIGATINL